MPCATSHVAERRRYKERSAQSSHRRDNVQVFHVAPGRGAERMAQDLGVPFLGRVPLDPELSRAAEEGRALAQDAGAGSNAPSRRALAAVIDGLLAALGEGGMPGQPAVAGAEDGAAPLQNGHVMQGVPA